MSYTTKNKVENYTLIDIDESFDTQVADWISAIETYINNYTNRTFGSSTPETRYFDGCGYDEQKIDDISTITSVQILEVDSSDVEFTLVSGAGNDYEAYPYNTSTKWKLKMLPTSQIAVWPTGTKRIKIVGIWGDSGVPEDIVLAATMLVGSIVKQGASDGQISSESLGDYSVTYRNIEEMANAVDVKEILNRYKIWSL